jgi:hypothetical protein
VLLTLDEATSALAAAADDVCELRSRQAVERVGAE